MEEGNAGECTVTRNQELWTKSSDAKSIQRRKAEGLHLTVGAQESTVAARLLEKSRGAVTEIRHQWKLKPLLFPWKELICIHPGDLRRMLSYHHR